MIAAILFGVFGLAATAWLFSRASVALKTVGLIKDTPTRTIRAARSGFVEVKGKVRGHDDLSVAPISQKPCIYWRLRVGERVTRTTGYGKRRRSSTKWVTVVDDARITPCTIDDGTGSVVVDLSSAELDLHDDVRFSSGFLNDAPPEIERLLRERYGRSSEGLVFNRTMRYQEEVLEPGDELYVLGTVHGDPPRIGGGGPAFLVSDSSEKQLVGRYTRKALGFGAGALVALAFTIVAVMVALTAPGRSFS